MPLLKVDLAFSGDLVPSEMLWLTDAGRGGEAHVERGFGGGELVSIWVLGASTGFLRLTHWCLGAFDSLMQECSSEDVTKSICVCSQNKQIHVTVKQ